MYCEEGPFMTFTFKFINLFIEKLDIKAFNEFFKIQLHICFP